MSTFWNHPPDENECLVDGNLVPDIDDFRTSSQEGFVLRRRLERQHAMQRPQFGSWAVLCNRWSVVIDAGWFPLFIPPRWILLRVPLRNAFVWDSTVGGVCIIQGNTDYIWPADAARFLHLRWVNLRWVNWYELMLMRTGVIWPSTISNIGFVLCPGQGKLPITLGRS